VSESEREREREEGREVGREGDGGREGGREGEAGIKWVSERDPTISCVDNNLMCAFRNWKINIDIYIYICMYIHIYM
jgi:hypothetical protein